MPPGQIVYIHYACVYVCQIVFPSVLCIVVCICTLSCYVDLRFLDSFFFVSHFGDIYVCMYF